MAAIEHPVVEYAGTGADQAPFVMMINAHIRLRRLQVQPMVGLGIEQAEVWFHGVIQLLSKKARISLHTSLACLRDRCGPMGKLRIRALSRSLAVNLAGPNCL